MGVWGAAQAIAFGAGGLVGAVGVDIGRWAMGDTSRAFILVFASEALLFLVAAGLALRLSGWSAPRRASARRADRELAL